MMPKLCPVRCPTTTPLGQCFGTTEKWDNIGTLDRISVILLGLELSRNLSRNVPSCFKCISVPLPPYLRMGQMGQTSRTSHCAVSTMTDSHSQQSAVSVEDSPPPSIALSAAVVHAMTSPMLRWGNDEYPPIADRLTAMIAANSQQDDSNFWLHTACLMVALFCQEPFV